MTRDLNAGGFVIPSVRLDLVLQTPDEVNALIESMPSADRAEVSPEWLARVRVTQAGDPWALSFSLVERSSGNIIGSCAFKGPPDPDGVVEVAYGIAPPHQRQGHATEAVEALTRFAFTDARVERVRAQTKADNVASARVLEKCRFRRLGEVEDPEDGLVFRWERTREL